MTLIIAEIVILFLLLAANGMFAMTEIAIVSARKGRLRQLAERGDPRARAALALAESPNRFLATVQIGITLVGMFAGAFGGVTLAAKLAQPISQVPFLSPYAPQIGFAIVVATLTYFSLVIGELLPKRLGLNNPEAVSMGMARMMDRMARLAGPIVRLLGASTDGLLGLFGVKTSTQAVVSEEEVRVLMQEGLRAGAFNKAESQIVHRALELDQLSVRDLMTPRPKIIWLNQTDTHEAVWHKIVVSAHSNFPVYEGNRDNVVGIVTVKAIYANIAAGTPASIAALTMKPLIVPVTQTAVQLLETFKATGKHLALVTDEFGSIVGLVTLHDVMEAIVGELPSVEERARPQVRKRGDGSLLVDGLLEIENVEAALPGFKVSDDENMDYQTLAGFIVKRLDQVPEEGQTLEFQGYVFEVLDMDNHRVDKVIIMPVKPPDKPPAAE